MTTPLVEVLEGVEQRNLLVRERHPTESLFWTCMTQH